MDGSFPFNYGPPLPFSPADVVCTQQLAKFKGSPAMEKLCDDNDIRVVTSSCCLSGTQEVHQELITEVLPRHITNGVTADGRFKVVDKKYLARPSLCILVYLYLLLYSPRNTTAYIRLRRLLGAPIVNLVVSALGSASLSL